MERMLHGYSDLQVLELLKYGFPIGYNQDNVSKDNNPPGSENIYCKNHRGWGARDFPDSINKYLIKEACHGAIMGPFKQNPFKDDIKLSPYLNLTP